jgi:bisphosphoglycerate-independent phosphoglycerate mutase (AlkP superfamily)
MVNYSDRHNEYMTSVFPPKDIRNCLGEVIANHGLKQLRAAETEKYPHGKSTKKTKKTNSQIKNHKLTILLSFFCNIDIYIFIYGSDILFERWP